MVGEQDGGLSLQLIFKKWGLTGSQILEGGYWEREAGQVTLKVLFSVVTKNKNWEILTKNLVIFKRRNGVKDPKF